MLASGMAATADKRLRCAAVGDAGFFGSSLNFTVLRAFMSIGLSR